MAIIVDHPVIVDLLLLEAGPAEADGSKTNAMADDAKMLNTFSVGQRRANLHSPLHDADC